MPLDTPIEIAHKINNPVIKALDKLKIRTVSDLLFYFPFRYEDFSNITKISDVKIGQQVSIRATLKQIRAVAGFNRFVNRAEAIVSDDSGSIKVVWFNQSYLVKSLKPGDEIYLSGTAGYYKSIVLQNPIYEKMSADKENIHTARILPIYRLTGNLSLRSLRTLVHSCMPDIELLEENLPNEIIKNLNLPDIKKTVRNLHFPPDIESLTKAKARIAFEEIFKVQLAVQKHKMFLQSKKSPKIPFKKELIQTFVKNLPFALNADQKLVTWQILKDLQQNTPMNRLVEGDVGSGKTIVAFICALAVLDRSYQVAMLCPTEILAQQHYAAALKYFADYPQISLVLLTSKITKINNISTSRKALLEELAHGGPHFVIGTHAALEKNVRFKKLALVIIDEQHRFGVRQRSELLSRGKTRPHLISMTATPIPRSLKLALFGDLEISQIKQLPKGRKKIITRLVMENETSGQNSTANTTLRQQAYAFITEQIMQGRQAFIVAPLIEESDSLGIKSATALKESMTRDFPKLKIGLLHGRMKSEEKEKVMQSFLDNDTQILVSTSVIEVGIDIKNASVIVIEGADRFGLAQLHQLRGRVGRSEHQSYCILFSSNPNAEAQQRLTEFTQTNDGFELAEMDLKLRGYGNIFGEDQSGFYYFKFFSFMEHKQLASAAQEWAKKILAEDPSLNTYPKLQESIKDKLIHLE